MGFYNIFRIIRLIFKDIFGYKTFRKILIIFLLIFLLCFFYTKCFCASTLNFTYNNHTYTINNIPDDYNYVFIGTNKNSTYFCIYCSKQPLEFHTNDSNYLGPLNINSNNNYYNYNFRISSANENNYVIDDTVQRPVLYNSATYGGLYANNTNYIYSNYDVKVNGVVIHTSNDNQLQYINPTLGNSQSDLENLNFSNFIINANSYTEDIENNDGTLYMLFYNKSLDKTTVDYLYPIKEKGFTKGSIYTDYENSTSDNMVFSFPLFMSGVFFNVGSTYQIRFAKMNYNTEYGIDTYEYLGQPYTFTINSNVTQDYINQLNQQTATSSDSESTQELQSSINQQTQSINDINNSINDSNVDNSSINLPTDNTNDPTQSGVDNIFQTIYNSFTSGTPQDIVFPIPFTNQSITLQANYVYNMLQRVGANWIINLIQAFWWYVISRFIIIDIMGKIRKIKQGNFENIQNSNIKEDML